MIYETLCRLEPYKYYFLAGFLVSNTLAVVVSQSGILPDILPNIPIPDVAFMEGCTILSPSDVVAWYGKLEADPAARTAYFWLVVLDLLSIIPTYTLWLGSEIATASFAQQRPFDLLCHVPIWTALLDILETGTHFLAIQDRYFRVEPPYYTPSHTLLAFASLATVGKFVGLLLCLLLLTLKYILKWTTTKTKSREKES